MYFMFWINSVTFIIMLTTTHWWIQMHVYYHWNLNLKKVSIWPPIGLLTIIWSPISVSFSKFQEMILNNHPDSCEISLCVKLNDCVKLLGVYIDVELKFTNHVDHLCKRTSRQLSATRRIAKYLNKDCIMKLFNAFILSNFNYSSIVWHFCPHESTSKVEKINKSAICPADCSKRL